MAEQPRITPDTATAAPAERFRAAVEFSLDGDLRYLSHHDELRLLARALVRARWPVWFSKGFNPMPRLSLPLPRVVGTASDCELALIDLRELRPVEELFAALAAVLPEQCRLWRVTAPAARGTPQPRAARYQIELSGEDAERAAARCAGVLSQEQLTVARGHGPHKPARPVEIRAFIDTVVLEGRTLEMRLRFAGQNTARPTEILTALGLAADAYAHRVRRVAVEWNNEPAGPPARPAAPERISLGKTEENCHQETGPHPETA